MFGKNKVKGVDNMKFNKAEFENKQLKFLRTNRGKIGIPCMWENTKEFDTMKKITKVYNAEGGQITPIYVSIKNGSSLLPLSDGDLVLKIFIDEDGNGMSLFRLLSIDKYSNEANSEIIVRKSSKDTDYTLNENATIDTDLLNKIIKEFEAITAS